MLGEGCDNPLVLNSHYNEEIVLKDAENERTVIVETGEVGVVVYSGNSLSNEGEISGVSSRKYLGICLETQGLPDAIHYPAFPSVIINKGQKYNWVTKYRFGVSFNSGFN